MHHPDTLAMRVDHVTDESDQRHRRMTVLIAEDHYLMREGTRRLLAEREDVEVVGVAADYDGVLSEARRLRPDPLAPAVPNRKRRRSGLADFTLAQRVVPRLLLGVVAVINREGSRRFSATRRPAAPRTRTSPIRSWGGGPSP